MSSFQCWENPPTTLKPIHSSLKLHCKQILKKFLSRSCWWNEACCAENRQWLPRMDPWVIISGINCLMLFPVCLRKGSQESVPGHKGRPLLVMLPFSGWYHLELYLFCFPTQLRAGFEDCVFLIHNEAKKRVRVNPNPSPKKKRQIFWENLSHLMSSDNWTCVLLLRKFNA